MNIFNGEGSSDSEECVDVSILNRIFNAFLEGVFALLNYQYQKGNQKV